MWHEARKQEKKIRGMMVDYKRRAERRRDYYERIKQDPAQFLQVHGRPAKIHLDPAIAIAADSPATMMPWQGQTHNLIDRFDVRAHLDIIPEHNSKSDDVVEDRQECYERYRTLVQNDFLGVNEDKFLHQIFLEERYGIFKPGFDDADKKKLAEKKAAIGYVYEDSTESPPRPVSSKDGEEDEDEEEEKEEDISDIDLDVTVDINVLTAEQSAEMNEHSLKYGMVDDDFITYLTQDKDEAEKVRMAREIEEEKAMFSGRKSRRERRALREKKLAGRVVMSPPSYAAKDSPTYSPLRQSISKSRSRSPVDAGKIMFITSFGGDGQEGDLLSKSTDKAVSAPAKLQKSKESVVIGPHLPKSKDEQKSSSRTRSRSNSSRSPHRSNRRRSQEKVDDHHRSHKRCYRHPPSDRSRSPNRSRDRHDKRDKNKRRLSRSRSISRSRSYSTSKSRSRSHSRHKSHSAKRKSRSKSRSKSVGKQSQEESSVLPPPPIKSYYRHSLSKSNSEISESEEDSDKSPNHSGSAASSITGISRLQPLLGKASLPTKVKMTPQERLKKKMQLQLKKQYKADKKAQMEKSEKQMQERQDRAEELREMAIKLRQRERERRHRMRGYSNDSDSDSAWSKHGDSSRRAHSVSSDSSSSRETSHSKSHRTVPRDSPDRRKSNSPHRRRSPRHSPRRSPHHTSRRSRSPRTYRRQSSPRKCSPLKEDSRKYPSNRHSPDKLSSRSYRRSNSSPTQMRASPSRTYKHRPLVDY